MEKGKVVVSIGGGEQLDALVSEQCHDATRRMACDPCLEPEHLSGVQKQVGIEVVSQDAVVFLNQKENQDKVSLIVVENVFGDPRVELLSPVNVVRGQGSASANYSATVLRIDDKVKDKAVQNKTRTLVERATGRRLGVAASVDPQLFSLALELVLEERYDQKPPQKRIAIAKASYKSLTSGGRLVIHETLTPYNRDKIFQILELAKFDTNNIVLVDEKSAPDRYRALLQEYNLMPENASRRQDRVTAGLTTDAHASYIIVARKA